jgi:hypothetical protein
VAPKCDFLIFLLEEVLLGLSFTVFKRRVEKNYGELEKTQQR